MNRKVGLTRAAWPCCGCHGAKASLFQHCALTLRVSRIHSRRPLGTYRGVAGGISSTGRTGSWQEMTQQRHGCRGGASKECTHITNLWPHHGTPHSSWTRPLCRVGCICGAGRVCRAAIRDDTTRGAGTECRSHPGGDDPRLSRAPQPRPRRDCGGGGEQWRGGQ